jgi:hypothetical protein
MARTVENRLFIGDFGDSSKPVIAIGRYLLADANHASEERAHGWLVVDAADPKALAAMADLALEFATQRARSWRISAARLDNLARQIRSTCRSGTP